MEERLYLPIWAVLGYWLFIWAANRRGKTYRLPLSFIEGGLLACFSFVFLPEVFADSLVYGALGALSGIFASAGLEKTPLGRESIKKYIAAGLVTAAVFTGAYKNSDMVLIRGILGGCGLYFVCGGLTEEKMCLRERLAEGATGICGFLAGTALCFL